VEIAICPQMKREFLLKFNREFESNPLRQLVGVFSFSTAIVEKTSILRRYCEGFTRGGVLHMT